jgi:hypothetical protein
MPPPPPGGIRAHDPSKRSAAELYLRPRGHSDWLQAKVILIKYPYGGQNKEDETYVTDSVQVDIRNTHVIRCKT